MNDLLSKLFPEGQRKLIVSLIALIVGVVVEKYQGGLSPELQQALIAIVAIFTGGNVMEHLSKALIVIKGTKAGQIVEDILPGDQGLGKDIVPVAQPQAEESDPLREYIVAVDNACGKRFGEIEQKLAQTNQNITKLIEIVNAKPKA